MYMWIDANQARILIGNVNSVLRCFCSGLMAHECYWCPTVNQASVLEFTKSFFFFF